MAESRSANDTERLCGICNLNVSKYCCPRCEILYCSLNCYKSEKHVECSESFYRDCVNEELSTNYAGDEAKQKMLSILQKLQNQNLDFNESDTLQGSEDRDGIIDSDDDAEIDLHDRVKDLNLDDADAIWNALTEDEKNEFEALVHGEVGSILPHWEPWWMYNQESKLVEEIGTNDVEHMKKCPPLKIVPKLSLLTNIQPSPAIKFNIINVLASYVFVMRYFNGDVDPAEEVLHLLDICGNLSTNSNFDETATAVESVVQRCLQSQLIETDELSLKVMKHDTFMILKGPNKENKSYYCKAALSELLDIFIRAKEICKNLRIDVNVNTTKQGPFAKRFPEHRREYLPKLELNKIKKCIKKLEYYLSYVNSCDMDVKT